MSAEHAGQPRLDARARKALGDALEQARRAMGFETLETRRRDSLDFRDVAVWTAREAVQRAFEAGYRAGLEAAR